MPDVRQGRAFSDVKAAFDAAMALREAGLRVWRLLALDRARMAGQPASSVIALKPEASPRTKPLVAHIVYRFDVGGLENGVVNLVNRMTDWRHVVIALTEVVPAYRERVSNTEVEFVSLHKPPGHGWRVYPQLVRELRRRRPRIVHTRNLAALEMQIASWWAGVPVRVHGEHGRDAHDVDGTMRRYQWLRRAHRPILHHWIALSRDLSDYLTHAVGIPPSRITQIYNGVDHLRFAPANHRQPIDGCPFSDAQLCVMGTVGRMQTVKAQPLLAHAFVKALQEQPGLRDTLRLVMVGDGPLRGECESILDAAGAGDLAWFGGERSDVPAVMRGLDVFVLPSLAEGISNTILEAMASAVPVIATDVGGNADLVLPGSAGEIVPAGDVQALAAAMVRWAGDPALRRASGRAARDDVERRFSLQAMVQAYRGVYERLIAE